MWGRIPTSLSTPISATLQNLRPSQSLPTPLTLQTNRIARQTPSSALLTTPNTTLLATLTPAPPSSPLLVDFRAKAAAVGIIPRTWSRREQKPALRETLIARLIDRSLRPVAAPAHITVSLLSATKLSDFPVDALAVNAAAATLAGMEEWSPLAAARVALVGDEFIPFPGDIVNDNADLSVFVAVNENDRLLTMAVDHVNDAVPERVVVDAIAEGISAASRIIPVQKQFREQILELRNREGYSAFPRKMPTRETEKPPVAESLLDKVYDFAKAAYQDAFVRCREFPGKAHRAMVVTETQQHIVDNFPDLEIDTILSVANRAAKEAHHEVVLRDGLRMDGRRFDEIRQIRAETSILHGDVHGSALFERGDTQVLACSTVGLKRQAIQTEEYVEGGENKPFFVHYSFPPFATGEYGRFGGHSSRREIGHAALTENAIEPLLKMEDKDYPYALRISAEVIGSDGSSSMATVCAGSLALWDAGAPLREPVAGVAMGLLSKDDGEGYGNVDGIILTDILGAEDHFGEMDMKVTGTRDGVTACQLDLKRAGGLSLATIDRAFEKAKVARQSILEDMAKGLEEPREIPEHAPRAETIQVNAFVAIQTMMKDRAAGLREIEASTETSLTFNGQKQTMTIEAPNLPSLQHAKKLIALKMSDLEVGSKLEATISDVKRSYAVAELSAGGVSGLLHVSKMQINPSQHDSGDESKNMMGMRYPDARKVLSLGDTVEVVVLESDRARNILRLGLVSPPQTNPKEALDTEIDSVLAATSSKRSKL